MKAFYPKILQMTYTKMFIFLRGSQLPTNRPCINSKMESNVPYLMHE